MYQGPLPAPGRLPIRPRRRGSSYQGVGRGHHPPLAWLPPLARAQQQSSPANTQHSPLPTQSPTYSSGGSILTSPPSVFHSPSYDTCSPSPYSNSPHQKNPSPFCSPSRDQHQFFTSPKSPHSVREHYNPNYFVNTNNNNTSKNKNFDHTVLKKQGHVELLSNMHADPLQLSQGDCIILGINRSPIAHY